MRNRTASSSETISRARIVAMIACLLAPLAVILMPASAAVHAIMITEVYAGSPDNPDAQFIEIQSYSAGQNQTQGHEVSVYNGAGTKVGSFVFSAPQANSTDLATVLVATSAAQSAFSVTADLAMTAVIPASGGKVCFNGPNPDDCVAWGNYSGSTTGIGNVFNPTEGLVAGASISRRVGGGSNTSRLDPGDDTNDSTADFALTAPPTPVNNAGVPGSACCSTGFSASSYSTPENAGVASVTVTRNFSGTSSSVNYSTSNGTASAGTDYTSNSGTLTFANGETSKSFDVAILTDSLDEYDETVNLSLRSPSTGVFSRVEAVIKIQGNLLTTVPSAPQSLTAATGAGVGQISLSWSPPSTNGGLAITNYRIRTWRGTVTSGAPARITTVSSSINSYTEGGLSPGTVYSFTVAAINGLGEGAQSNVAAAQTRAVPPSSPQNLVAAPSGAGSTLLRWDPPASSGGATITKYRVYRGSSSGGETFLVETSWSVLPGGAGYTTSVSSCPTGSICYFQLSAVNSAGEGTRSGEAAAPSL